MEVVSLLILAALAAVLVICFLLFRKFAAVLQRRRSRPGDDAYRRAGTGAGTDRAVASRGELAPARLRRRRRPGAPRRGRRRDDGGIGSRAATTRGCTGRSGWAPQSIQDDNATKLEQMRATVDEKLQGTLEKRLGESFRLVSERLRRSTKGWAKCRRLPRESATSRRC